MEAYDGHARHHDADDVRAARPQMNTATRLQQQQQFVAATHATVLFARVVIRVRSEHLGMKQAGMVSWKWIVWPMLRRMTYTVPPDRHQSPASSQHRALLPHPVPSVEWGEEGWRKRLNA